MNEKMDEIVEQGDGYMDMQLTEWEKEEIQQMLARYPGRKYEVLEWKQLFQPEVLEAGQRLLDEGRVTREKSWYSKSYTVQSGWKRMQVRIGNIPDSQGETWKRAGLDCTCHHHFCEHMAAALLCYEKEFGHAVAWEREFTYRERKRLEQQKLLWEKRREEDKQFGLQPVPALTAFQDMVLLEPVIFDLEKALSSWQTTPAAIHRMKEAEKDAINYGDDMDLWSDGRGKESIRFRRRYRNELKYEIIQGTLDRDTLQMQRQAQIIRGTMFIDEEDFDEDAFDVAEDERRTETEAPTGRTHLLDECELAEIMRLWNQANVRATVQVTDRSAEEFFKGIRAQREEKVPRAVPQAAETNTKKPCVELLPRILVNDGEPSLSFRVGVTGSRLYVVKDCYTLLEAVEQEGKMALGKSESLDFGRQTFRPECLPLLDFIKRHRTKAYGGVYQVDLKNSAIDNFYDMGQGSQCDYQDKTNNIKSDHVHVGHTDIRFTLTADRLADARGKFIGIVVSGLIPVLIRGNSYRYMLNPQALSRVTQEEQRVMAPFLKVADDSGYFRFQVGTDRLQEFYYRVLPGLMDHPFVQFVDHCEEETAALLPPEPVFRFDLDLEENLLSLKGIVRYGEEERPLLKTGWQPGAYRDTEQESAVIRAVEKWLPNTGENVYSRTVNDDQLYDFLTAGLPTLEFYGQVRGTSAFRARKVTPPPHVRLSISVEGEGLMDLSVTSQDLSAKELLEIYDSYTKKKRYYRLKSGDFIDLTRNEEMKELETFLNQLELSPKDVISRKIQVPLYRALYLDRMLEEHNQLATTRDRTYRALIRNFKTVREAEFEVPPVLDNVLRPYQVYGYKWLRTLQAAGFGGILADEMGLGKTVQMISVFQADRERQEAHRPSLVVCPASLVYNWQAEIQRFAPELKALPVTGTAGVREKLLAQETQTSDVLITSYDLLKRDIVHYQQIRFRHCVLDEAQYIKNSHSAAAKSVKLIRADHRFALTGTPIENRLLELWSVFDYLMPGFLYGQAEFEKRFELPITKQKDEQATLKLKSMTSPFILRRKKSEVLQDLPEKLEEIRYARLGGQQQKLYDAQVVRMKQMLSGGELAGEEKIKIFAELTRIRQICCDPSLLMENYAGESAKREACLELVQSAIEGGHRMLIFSQFVTMLELLEKDLTALNIPCYKIIGATSKEKRIAMVRDFNEGDVPVFLISLKAGGTGLNLTGADVVIHYDPWWNLAAQNQATDRAHRIGQTRQVTVFKLILKNTIEERIVALQDAKRDLAEAVLEGERESLLSLSNEELLSLLDG